MMTFPFNLIDLTHNLSSLSPTYDGTCGFSSSVKSDYTRKKNISFRIQELHLDAGVGTHIDAPAHCYPEMTCVDNIPISDLLFPCSVIDVSEISHSNFIFLPCHIEEWESKHEKIGEGSCVIVRSGWDLYFSNRDLYRNDLVFPTISKEAAQLLLERNISSLCVDTLSPDLPRDGFPVHRIILHANKYIVENVANAHLLPPVGSYVLVAPLKFTQATESPVRMVGFVSRK